ncbi:hypothetical protein GCM10009646_37140 [Streptomyces aureus]
MHLSARDRFSGLYVDCLQIDDESERVRGYLTFHSCGCGGPGYQPRSTAEIRERRRAAKRLGLPEQTTLKRYRPLGGPSSVRSYSRQVSHVRAAVASPRSSLLAPRSSLLKRGVAGSDPAGGTSQKATYRSW